MGWHNGNRGIAVFALNQGNISLQMLSVGMRSVVKYNHDAAKGMAALTRSAKAYADD
jgi:hypothetical protein